MPLYRVKSVSACGTPFTVGKDAHYGTAFKMAELNRHATGRRPEIWLGKRKMPY